jgi:hypothetical protein
VTPTGPLNEHAKTRSLHRCDQIVRWRSILRDTHANRPQQNEAGRDAGSRFAIRDEVVATGAFVPLAIGQRKAAMEGDLNVSRKHFAARPQR